MVRSPLRKLKKSPRSPFGGQSGGAPVLSNFVDDLAEPVPTVSYDSDQAGEHRVDYHSSSTPPAAGAGDFGTTTFSASAGTVTPTLTLPVGTYYIHFRLRNSNILTSQQVTVTGDALLMETGTDILLMEDGSSQLLLESA